MLNLSLNELQLIANGSTYDYHFIIKKLVEKLEGQFECF